MPCDHHRLVVEPHDRPVGPHDPIVGDERFSRDAGAFEALHHPGSIVGVERLFEQVGIGLPLLVGVPADLGVLGAVVDRRRLLVERIDIDRKRQLLDQDPVALLGLEIALLSKLSLGHVVDHALHERRLAAIVDDGDRLVAQPSLHTVGADQPVFTSVGIAARDSLLVSGGGRLAIIRVDSLSPAVVALEPLLHRHRKQLFQLRADVHRLTGDRGVEVGDRGRLLDQRAKPRFRLLEPLQTARRSRARPQPRLQARARAAYRPRRSRRPKPLRPRSGPSPVRHLKAAAGAARPTAAGGQTRAPAIGWETDRPRARSRTDFPARAIRRVHNPNARATSGRSKTDGHERRTRQRRRPGRALVCSARASSNSALERWWERISPVASAARRQFFNLNVRFGTTRAWGRSTGWYPTRDR